MFAVFDQLRRKDLDGSVSDKKVLKLVRAGELLVSSAVCHPQKTANVSPQEQIELDTLQHQVLIDEERARSQMIPDDSLCVLVIVKTPLLALRYQLADGQARPCYPAVVPRAELLLDPENPNELSARIWL